jgi:hypothetical protein
MEAESVTPSVVGVFRSVIGCPHNDDLRPCSVRAYLTSPN